jgi:hypothetical protein
MDKGGGGWASGWRRREVDRIGSEDRLLGFAWMVEMGVLWGMSPARIICPMRCDLMIIIPIAHGSTMRYR